MPFDAMPDGDTLSRALNVVVQYTLEDVAGRITHDTWCQGAFHNDKGEHCLVGWIDVVLSELPASLDAKEAIAVAALQRLFAALPRTARRRYEMDRETVTRYNDTRTYQTVLKLLKRATEQPTE
jgi:glycogen debranching enzyme